jgi:hypothetical protein
MKLSSGVGLTGLGVFGVVLAVSGISATGGLGCSSSSSGSSCGGGGGGGDTCTSSGVTCVTAPAAPSGGTPTSASHNYAVHTLYLGDTDRTGVASPNAWEAYGYNLDNLVTAKTSTDVCTLAAGASKITQVDGNGGIDNSFGENILPIVITTAGSDAASKINTAIDEGHFTIMTYITGFDDSAGNSTSAAGLKGVLLAGGNYADLHDGGAPSWDTTTHWPILPTLINGCTPTGGCPAGTDPVANAQITFPSAYQAGGTFVNGSPGDLNLTLSIGGESLTISVHSALITFQPKAPGEVTGGVIAGTLITTELVSSLQSVAGSISTSLCSGSAFQSIAQQIEQASDIIIDPNSHAVSNSAGTACNGISIGLGFDATEIAAPTAADIEAVQPAAANPCSDAGAD